MSNSIYYGYILDKINYAGYYYDINNILIKAIELRRQPGFNDMKIDFSLDGLPIVEFSRRDTHAASLRRGMENDRVFPLR